MRLSLVAFILFFTSQSHAKLSSGSFQIHVRPQLVGIYQDFKQILNTFTDYPTEAVQLIASMDRLRENAYSLRAKCPLKPEMECMDTLLKIQKEARDLEWLFLHYQSNTHYHPTSGISPLTGLRIWLKMDKDRSKLQRFIDIEILCLSASRASERASTAEITKLIDQMESYSDLLVVEFIPPKYQEDFRSVWMNFFRPLHRHAELEGRIEFLTSNLQSLNFYWNLLNMRMTKRVKKTPEGMSGPLHAIQNRWNQVMRVIYAH